MNRILTITNKNLKEIFHDYSSLVLIIVAPIVVLLLLKAAFVTNQSPHVKIGTYHMNGTVTREINKSDQVSLIHYHCLAKARHAMNQRKNDGIIYNQHRRLHIIYANTNTTKTSEMKGLIQFALLAAVKDKSVQANHLLMIQNQKLLKAVKQSEPQIPSRHRQQRSDKASMEKPQISYNYGNRHTNFFNSMMPIMISLFVFMFVFLVTGMAMLKEKLNGTLSQILVTPTRRSQIVGGYTVSYGILAIVQATIVSIFAIWALRVPVVGSLISVIIISILMAVIAVVVGLFVSTLTSSEYQMTQMIPLIIVPQLLFSGIIPISSMGIFGKVIAHIIPVWYSSTAIKKVILYGMPLSSCMNQIVIMILFIIIFFMATTVSLKKFRKI